MTFKTLKDEGSINTRQISNSHRYRSKAKKSRVKSKSSNEGDSEDQNKKNDNQNGTPDLIERLHRITMKYQKKEEENVVEKGESASAEKQSTDDSTGGNASPTPAKEVEINDREKVKAEAKLALSAIHESKGESGEPSRVPPTGKRIQPAESLDDPASRASKQVAVNSKATDKKPRDWLQKKLVSWFEKKEVKLVSAVPEQAIGDGFPITAEKSVKSEVQSVKSHDSIKTEKRGVNEPIRSTNSDHSIKTEKKLESVEKEAAPEGDGSGIDNIAADNTAVDAPEVTERNNLDKADDAEPFAEAEDHDVKSGGVLNHGLFPKPIQEEGVHDGVLFFNPGM